MSFPASGAGRREARERAVELAYEAELRSWNVDSLLGSLQIEPDSFVIELLRLSEGERERSLALIEKKSSWKLSRMPVMDLVIMRMAVAELLTADTPKGVILSEAVELASRYSTDDSGPFINGVLAAIANDLAA